MFYQGITSVIQVGEKVKSKREEYLIKKIINVGLANTYLAENSKKREVFLKQFKNKDKKFISSQREIFRYIREIHNQDKSLSKVLEFVFEQFLYKDYFFEVKAKIKGENLESFLYDSNPVDFKRRVKIAKMLVYIVGKLHNYNIIHTDLKFEQFIYNKGFLKLIDFSNIIIENRVYIPAGTPGYKSPEHIKNEKITQKSDIFTLGILLYTLLAYEHPFSELLEKGTYDEELLNSSFTPLHKKFSFIPFKISQIISKALDFNPNNRPNAWSILKSFDYFQKPFLDNGKRQFFLYKFPLFFNRDTAKFIVFRKYQKFIASPHFIIDKRDDKFFLQTVKLQKGFFYPLVNGNKVFKEVELKDGDEIQIGTIKLKFYERML